VNRQEEIERALVSRPVPEGFPSSAVLPDYAGYSIAAVPSLIAGALGIADIEPPRLESIRLPVADRVVLLIVDGLGYRSLCRLTAGGELPAIRSLMKEGLFFPLTSVFPSTTVAALATLTTGLTPLSHGMIGYRLYLRESASITNMIRFSLVGSNHNGSAIDAGLDPDRLLPRPTFYERLGGRRVSTHALLPRHIAGSGLSEVLYRGCLNVHPMSSFSDMCVAARDILLGSTDRSLLTLYWPGLDAVAHVRGPESDSYLAEARAVDAALGHELIGRVDRTLFVITSDHGFVPMAPSDYVPLDEITGVGEKPLLPPVGEPRASYLFLRRRANETSDAGSVEKPKLLDGGILRLTAEQVITSGLLGDDGPHPETLYRLGDVVLASTGSAGVFHPYPDAAILRGMHGGLTADEMLVPLIAAAL